MPNTMVENVKAGLKGIRGAGDAIRGSTMEAADRALDPDTRGSAATTTTKNHAIAEQGRRDLRRADEALLARGGGRGGHPDRDAPPPGAAPAATKPVLARGPSVMDGTAVTSAAPTPAAGAEEVPDPMGGGGAPGRAAPRQRESHLPDLDAAAAARGGDDDDDDGEEEDGFGADLARRGTARGRRDTTTRWEGWSGAEG